MMLILMDIDLFLNGHENDHDILGKVNGHGGCDFDPIMYRYSSNSLYI